MRINFPIKFFNFKRVENWEGFTKFVDKNSKQIIAFKGVGSLFTQLLRLPEPDESFVLISASPSILKELEDHRAGRSNEN